MGLLSHVRWRPKLYTADDMAESDAARDQLLESAMHWRRLAEERQHAIDMALSFLHGSQYVGGPSEKEAWDHVWELLGPLRTEHKGQGAPIGKERSS